MKMSLAARLLVRDWRGGETPVLLMALVVAVAAMSAVGFFTDRVGQAVRQGAGEALAADLRVESNYPLPADYPEAARAEGLATARVVQFRSVLMAGGASSLSDIRWVSEGYPLRGEVRVADALAGEPRAAAGVPGRGEAWVEPALLARLGLDVGDTLQIGGLDARVARTLEFRPDEGWRLMELAPTVLLNVADVEVSGLIQPGSVVEYEWLFAGDEPQVESFRRRLEGMMGPEEELDDIRDARPEMRSSIERAERFLLLSALVSVLLGGVAVAMASRRYLARHLDSVALMKCVGARHRDVLRLTLTQLLSLALVAGVAGTLLGYVAQRGLVLLLGDLVEARLPAPGPDGFLIGPVTALTVALGFALPPLLQLRKVPPARVLRRDLQPPPLGYAAVYGTAVAAVTAMLYWLFQDLELIGYLVAGAAATFAALYASGRVMVLALRRARGGVGIAWRYGIANVARRGRDSSVQVVAFGIGLMGLLVLMLVRTELMSLWRSTLPETAANHFLINIQPEERAEVVGILAEHGLEAPRFAPLVRARISHVNGVPLNEYEFRDRRTERELRDDLNVTWAAEPGPDNEIVAGRWWREDDPEPQLSIAAEELVDFGLALGDELTFAVAGQSATVRITSTRDINWDSFRPNFFMVVNPGVLDGFAHTYITSFHLERAQRGAMLDLVTRLPGVSVIDIDAVLDQARRAMDRATSAVQYVFLFTLAAGLVILLAAIQATRDERMYESAVLRTLGAGRGVVLQGIAAEFTAIGVLAGTLAAAGAGLIGYFAASELFDLEYLPGPLLLAAGLLGGALVVGVSGTLAARSVVKEPPVSTLRRI